ncbi:hypothetical protein CNMCM6106_005088 [Aspergillus hiratsukae]|uniref:ABC transporter domain-containing protein n=1 Tax=Aspergillus hiratsukae TaxID=1194566 RepID=A0A8H6PQX9_9EURO|nr:hypothetical protein CNMCM6106_005088 [Aspergillus hiratsukae]
MDVLSFEIFLESLGPEKSCWVNGHINYSGLTLEDVRKYYRGEVIYVPEDDAHFPTLNVQQTLEFALQSKTPKRYQERIPRYLEIYGRVFGMSHTMKTLVGNEYIRGVSGGERKRISIIESLATDSSVMCWDNSTRGLDASSALDYIRSLRIMTDTCGKATLLTLYQASDAIFDLVDKVLLIDEGRMLYQGPAEEAKAYFENLGYQCAEMQTVSDFLTSITIPERRRFRPGWKDRAPKGAIELEDAFRKSAAFHRILEDIRNYEEKQSCFQGLRTSQSDLDRGSLNEFKSTVQTEKSRFVSPKSPYTISLFRQVVLCGKRQMWQVKGHISPLLIKLISCVIYGLLIGSMFYELPENTDGMYSRGGVIFYSSILLAWLQMSELEEAMQGRDILSRQKKFAFVRPSAVCLARVLVDLALVFALVLLFLIVVYFLAGLKASAGSFWIDFLFIYLCTICLTAQFRLFAAASSNFEVALRYSGVSVLFCIVFGGYVLSVDKLMNNVPWVGWIAYTTPALYTYEAMMAAEFHSAKFTCAPGSVVPSGYTYNDVAYQTCGISGSQPGTTTVDGDHYLAVHYGFYYRNVWRNFGILCLFTLVYIATTCWLSEALDWEPGSTGPIQYQKRGKSKKSQDEEDGLVQGLGSAPPPAQPSCQQPVQALKSTSSTFTWENLELEVQCGNETRKLLDDVNGYCRPGTLTALVGASGAGKSTLLTVLTQRQAAGTLSGTMSMDGHPVDESFKRNIGYCQQMDVHDETSTIREALEFSALLRQPVFVPKQDKLAYVDTVLHTLELVDFQNAIIGSLDIEKKKRVTIGVELCAKPSILVSGPIVGQARCVDSLMLDEPTSGLDSQGASSIVSLLRRLADQGLAVLCTIHQANQEQFEQFDRVLALSPGGRTYYFGEIGRSGRCILDYFTKYGDQPKQITNTADYLIEIVVGGMRDTGHKVDWADIWNRSAEADAIKKEISNIHRARLQNTESCGSTKRTQSVPPLYCQVSLLTQRTLRQYWRSPEYPYSRLYASFFHALVNGLTYLQIGNSATDLQSKAFSCFLVLMLVPEFINAISMRFILNRDIWRTREGPSGVYSWVAFCTAQIISEIPYAIISGVVFYVLYYFLVGLPLGFAAAYTFLMFFLFFLFATSWGQWIAALSADSMVAATLMPFFIIMCELFNGVLQPHKNMPVFWKYTMYYVTPFTYWIGGVLTSVLRGMPVICSQDELIVFESPLNMTCGEYAMPWLSSTGSGYLSNPDSYGHCGYCKYSRGDDYLSEIGLDESKIWPYLGIFTAFVISNYLMAGSLSSVRRAEDQDTAVNDRARASTDRGSPVYSGVYVFDSKHQRFPTRVTKPKSRSDEMQELRNRILTLENALAKASSIRTPETLGAEPSIVLESGPPTTGDERYLSEDIKSLPWASFRGKKTDTRYCGRSHSMLALSFFRDVGDFMRQRKCTHKKDSEFGSLRLFKKEMWLKQRQEEQQRVRCEQASSLVDLLPPRQVADELVQLYLSNFETTYRVLHIPTFLKQYEDYWTAPENLDMGFLAKLLLLMAASSCFYSPTTKINGKDSLSSTAIHWIEAVQTWRAASFASRNTNFDMLQVQCLLLIARQANALDGDTIWVSSGSLIRSAMTMGLHRNPLRFQKVSRFWAEMRRRLWATIQELDLQSSMDGGMPPTIDPEEYDCDPPSNYDDADLIESMTEDPPPRDPGIVTRSSFQVLLSRSLPVRVHIAKLVNRLRFTISYDEALRLSEELMQSLHDASDLFPSDRSLSHIPGVENPAFTKSYFIFLIRRHLLALHRPFCLSIMRTPKFSYSRKLCLDSAFDILSLLEPPLGDGAEAQPHPHLGHLTGGMFREELFHAAIMVCVEIVLQADEYSRSKSMLPGQSSVLSSINDMAASQQAVMVRAVENTIRIFGSRIAPGGRGCKPYLFLSLTLASAKARLKGEDSFRTMDQAVTNVIKDCHLLMSGVPWAEVRKKDGNSVKEASNSTPGLTAGTPLDLPFDPMSFVPSSSEDISPLDFGTLFDMTDYGASELWNNDFFSGF